MANPKRNRTRTIRNRTKRNNFMKNRNTDRNFKYWHTNHFYVRTLFGKTNENQWISMKFWNRYSNFKFQVQVAFNRIYFGTFNWNIQVNIWYFYLTVTEIFLPQCYFGILNLQLLLLFPSSIVFVLHIQLLRVQSGQGNNPCPWYKTGRKMVEFDNSEELF